MTKFNLRRFRALFLLVLGALMLATFVPKNTYATTSLQGTDFQAQSFSKTVDYYDYVRRYATANGANLTLIQNQHAYIYTTYINVGGFQLFYAGLLNAIRWRIYPNPLLPIWDSSTPRAFAQYSQLSFTYDLAIDPSAKTATLTTSYTVGRMTDLYLLTASPRVLHLNATGTYDLNGLLRGTQTIYQYLAQNGYKLSIVQSHMAVLASTNTSDTTDSGSSVDNNVESDVARTGVNTVASDNERVFRADFGVKSSYQLYNSTSGSQTNYNVTARTANRHAWGGNPVYGIQNAFMGFLPLFVYHVDPSLFQAARTGMARFTLANYLYIISYSTWGGYKIVNDPEYTAYYQPASNVGFLTAIFIAVPVAAGVGGVFAFIFRRRRTIGMAPMTGTTGPAPNQPPGPVTGPPGPTE